VDACAEALAAAELAWRRGLDQQAEASLIAARHGAMIAGNTAMVARCEVAMAEYALAVDDEERAATHLASAGPMLPQDDLVWQTRAWLAFSELQRRTGSPIPKDRTLPDPAALSRRDDTRELAARVCAECAAWARLRGDTVAARRHAQCALETAPAQGHERGRALIEMAEVQLTDYDHDGARLSYLAAIEEFRALGHQRDEGRAVASYALRVAPGSPPGTDEPPASWLGRAKLILGDSATWRDVASSRGGFRAHGRRLQDKAVSSSIATLIDALDHETSRMRAVVAASVDDAHRALGQAEHQAASGSPALQARLSEARNSLFRILEESVEQGRRVGGAASQMVDVIETTVVERDRMRGLLDLLAQVDTVTDAASLGNTAAAVGARLLHADRVLLVRRAEHGDLDVIGTYGGDESPPSSSWRSAVSAHLQGPDSSRRPEVPATRSDERPRGPVLVASLRASGIIGALYADKLGRSGRFNEQDHQLAQLFADYFGLAYGRLAAVDAKRRAFEQLAITLDTIRDGVLALDDDGVVRNANTAAARMLRMPSGDLVGQSLATHSTLAPLWELLSSSHRVDGSLVRIKQGSFIVSARPVAGQGGIVATLVELDRARQFAERISAARPRYVFEDIVGSSPSIRESVYLARQAANVDGSVLLTGESGTGKEVFAQSIHTGSVRSSEPFIGMNCAAVPRELLEAELFGYERGAFTGARSEGNPGKFELAARGTLLLDEVGDMPLDMQAKLLRVLQERVVVRLGGSAERPVRARVIATTHRDLEALVKTGRFRHDLFYRLQVLRIHLDPLRSRGQDVLLLASTFLRRFAALQHKRVERLSTSVEAALQQHDWPGNVRELANVLEREVSLLPAEVRVLDQLQTPLVKPTADPVALNPADASVILPLAEVERRTFLRALELCDGNVQQASSALGVSKVTFYAKLRAWGMRPRDRARRPRSSSVPPEA